MRHVRWEKRFASTIVGTCTACARRFHAKGGLHRAAERCRMKDRNPQNEPNLTGDPSDYGSRTVEDEEQEQRTADGEPRVERGTADSAVDHDEEPA